MAPVAPPVYHVLGYVFGIDNLNVALVDSTPFYDYTVPSGNAVSIAVAEDAFVVTQSPNGFIGIEVRNVSTSPPPVSLSLTPAKLGVAIPAGVAQLPTTVDAIISGGNLSIWYELFNTRTGTFLANHMVLLPAGTVVAQAQDPQFNSVPGKNVAVVATTNPNRAYYIDYTRQPRNQAPSSVAVVGSIDLNGVPSPADVDVQQDDVWIATTGSNELLHLSSPSLALLARGPLPCEPVTLDGGPIVFPDLVVVACRMVAPDTGLLLAFHGGNPLDVNPIRLNVVGEPVGMKATTIANGEYAVVVTKSAIGHQLQVFNVSAATNNPNRLPDVVVQLPGKPVDIALGIAPNEIVPPGKFKPGSKVAAISVIVLE